MKMYGISCAWDVLPFGPQGPWRPQTSPAGSHWGPERVEWMEKVEPCMDQAELLKHMLRNNVEP